MKELEILVAVPADFDPIAFCQPHEVELLLETLGIPLIGGADSHGQYGAVRRLRAGHPGDPPEGPPHHHIFIAVPDDYIVPAEVERRLLAALARGEPLPKPVSIPLPLGLTPQMAIDVLGFPGHEVIKAEHGSLSWVSNQSWKEVQVIYCCLDCKDKHNAEACALGLAKAVGLPERLQRLIVTREEILVPLPETLVGVDGQRITHKAVIQETVEDMESYLKRLHDWYKAAGCLEDYCRRC